LESGISRILGLTKLQVLIGMIIVRCLSFAVPAMAISILIGHMILSKIQKRLYVDDDEK
jgi:hypothetical protein